MGVSQTRSDFGSEEDDDMVHVNRQGTDLNEYKNSGGCLCSMQSDVHYSYCS